MAEPSTLFFALPAPDPVRALAGRLQEQARLALGPARYPELDGLHLTLAFLGPADPAQVPALLEQARGSAGPGCTLRTAGVGGFPRPGRARVLWLGFAPEPALDALAGRLREALRQGGVPFDGKPFMPHLTLARFRQPAALDRIALQAGPPLAWAVDRLALFQSVHGPGGSRYRELGAVPLTPPGGSPSGGAGGRPGPWP
jgi:2'-5' RNA ligase